jgi:hypothetical protein
MDRTRIEERMNFTRENYRMMRERLLKIIYWQPPEVIRLASRAVRADRKRDVIRPQIDLRPLPRKGGLLAEEPTAPAIDDRCPSRDRPRRT